MAFDFPSPAAAGQQVTGAGNQVYTFDGQKWAASGGGLNQATADARYVNVSGDTMAGDLLLAADPTASMQAANKHYIDNAINLAGNYLGTWSVAANTPSISAGGSIANANYVAVTVNPGVAETAPVGIPGIAGQSINNGDRIIWASGLSVWQILRNASVTLAAADARYVALAGSTMSGALVLAADPVADLQATTRQYVDNQIASHVGGGVTAIYYAARSTTTAAVDPGSGHVGFNTAAQGTATELYISGTSSQSVDWSLYWRGISAGTRLVIQRQTDSTIVCRFTLNSTAVDHGGWLTLSVTPYGTPAGFPQANNAALIVAIVTVGGNQFVATDGTIAMTGLLTLSGNPTANLHAATKQYVDGAAGAASSTTPSMDGAAAIGTGTTWARADHVHPVDTSRYAAANPSGYQTAANVTTALAAGQPGAFSTLSASGTVSGAGFTALLSPYATLAAPVFTGDARAVTPAVGDNDTSVATTAFVQAAVATAQTNVGRNLIHNAGFTVAQRGVGPWTWQFYTADRWSNSYSGAATMSTSIVALTDANRTSIGDEAAQSALRCVVTGSATAGSNAEIYQPIEGVRRLAGKTVTVSLWAFAAAGTPKLGVSVDQSFGTGGSPSAYISGAGQSVTISTTPARYSLVFAAPSVSGKTFGTNNDDSVALNIWFSGAADQNTITGTVGAQSGTFTIWGVQLEIGAVATPLEKRDPEQELRQCQRFYQAGNFNSQGYATAGAGFVITQPLPVRMRAAPAMATSGVTQTNCTGSLPGAVDYVLPSAVATATGMVIYAGAYTASADL